MSSSRKSDPLRRPRGSRAAVKRRLTREQDTRAMFDRLALQNPRLATAVLAVLKILAGANRQRAMQLIEAVSAIVMASPRKAPGASGERPGSREDARRGEAALGRLGWRSRPRVRIPFKSNIRRTSKSDA